MRLNAFLTIAAFAVIAAFSGAALAGSERAYTVGDFDRIDVSAGIRVIAVAGEPQSVVARSPNGDFDDLRVEVRGGELRLGRNMNKLRWHNKKVGYVIVIKSPYLRSLDASSGASASISKMESAQLVIDLSSGARAEIDGRGEECLIDLSSGSRLDAPELICSAAIVDVSSGASAEFSATDAVSADASSGGSARIHGEPRQVAIDRSSGGRVRVEGNRLSARDKGKD